MSNTKNVSAAVRKRGRGNTATARKLSRAAFKAWDTRVENAAFERRSKAAKKAAKTRNKNSS